MIILHILISLKIKIQAACNLHQAVRATFSASKKNCDISKIAINICCWKTIGHFFLIKNLVLLACFYHKNILGT